MAAARRMARSSPKSLKVSFSMLSVAFICDLLRVGGVPSPAHSPSGLCCPLRNLFPGRNFLYGHFSPVEKGLRQMDDGLRSFYAFHESFWDAAVNKGIWPRG